MNSVDLALAGVAFGAIAALSGIGLLVTYRTNGVLNLAHGGIATLAAYLFREMVVVWHWPMGLAAPVVLAVVAPAFGLLLERLVFRPLARRRASAAESLVASLGLLVLCVGIAYAIWGLGTRDDVPALFPTDPITVPGGSTIGTDAVAELALVVVICLVLGFVTARTKFGRQVRAVVDDRQLAELSAVPADRVAAFGWAVGASLAAFTGILLAPAQGLNPYGMTLLVLETFAVVVAARLSSFTVAVLTALALGIAQSEMGQLKFHGNTAVLVKALEANLLVAALLVLLLIVPKLRELGGDAGSTGRFSSRGAPGPRDRGDIIGYGASALLLMAPLTFAPEDLRSSFAVPALALIFLSLVVVTGYSGQISLGVAGYAGLGAILSAKLAGGQLFGLPALPGLAALFIGALLLAPIGWISGYPAIRRRGLALALTTFAVGAVVSRFVLEQPTFVSGLNITRPTLAGRELSDRAFYLLEMACLGIGLLLVSNLHRGRLGRALLAVRDHSPGAAAVGVNVRALKLLSFTASSVIAGLGGALLAQSADSFDSSAFDPLQSLLWFTAVVVFGADSAAGAVVAAGMIVTIDTLAGSGSSTLAIGLLALSLGWLPGGIAAAFRRLLVALREHVVDDALRDLPPLATGAGGVAVAPRTTPAGAALLAAVRASGARLPAPGTAVSTARTGAATASGPPGGGGPAADARPAPARTGGTP